MKPTARIALTYFIFSAIWIISTDLILQNDFESTPLELAIEISKGLFFITLSAGLIWVLLKRENNKRDEVEQQLRQAESQQRQLIEDAPASVLVFKKRKIIYANTQAVHFLEGQTTEDLLGVDIQDIIEPSCWDEARTRYHKLLNHDSNIYPAETTLITLNGTKIQVSIAAKLFKFEEQEALQFIAIDISQRVAAEKNLQKQIKFQKALLILNQAVQNMRVSDDFKYVSEILLEQLQDLDLPVDALATHRLIDPQKHIFETYRILQTETTKSVCADEILFKILNNKRIYNPNCCSEKSSSILHERFGFEICSYAEMPFQNGIVSIFSKRKHAFSNDILDVVETMAQILDTAYKRSNDLHDLALRNQELEKTNTRLHNLSHQTIHLQEQERRSLARELHDQVGQTLTSVRMYLQSLQTFQPKAQNVLEASLTNIDMVLSQVRTISLNLRPSILDDFGLGSALRWFIDRLPKTNTNITLNIDAKERRYPETIEITCFRFVQEALTNVIRHAQATETSVSLFESENKLMLSVCDNGIGFDINKAVQLAHEGQSLGLLSMKERIEQAGGHLTMVSSRNRQTELKATFEITAPQEITP